LFADCFGVKWFAGNLRLGAILVEFGLQCRVMKKWFKIFIENQSVAKVAMKIDLKILGR
jgi:hypothetical protein